MVSKMLNNLAVIIGSRSIYLIIRLLSFTYRIKEVDSHFIQEAKKAGRSGSYLLAIWHETVIGVTIAQMGRPFCTMTSRANAGLVLGYIMKKLGFSIVLGSKSSGGKTVRDEAINYLNKGTSVAIAVDGSSGPRKVAKAGVVSLASRSGAQILTVSAFADRKWILNTWDKMQIPFPFSIITLVYGQPITVASGIEGAEFDSTLNLVSTSLNECMAKAESLNGLGNSLPKQIPLAR